MNQTKILIFFLLVIAMMQSCIIPFDPQIESKDINKYVISGQVADNSGIQTVSVSRASAVGNPQFIPVSGCSVRIFNDNWHQFEMYETEAGRYTGKIDLKYMFPGASFMVKIVTPDGSVIESDFDTMNECPAIDSVYYIIQEFPSNLPGVMTTGLQFYVDLNGGNVKSRYFRWDVIETWEYHSDHPREWYYDGTVHQISPPDSSRMICWTTELQKNIYTLSTENLVLNKYSMLPLNFVNNHTSKLIYGYSLLLKQYAISEEAYSYWDQMRINSSDMGGLYEKQPLSITGNLHNISDPGQEVLGFFSAAMGRSKRIFIRNVENFVIDFQNPCKPSLLERGGFLEISPYDYPAFLLAGMDEEGVSFYYMSTLSDECVDCLSMGGTNIKPDFWPY
jgi:hypothetical protein